eukprot:gene17074-8592_t
MNLADKTDDDLAGHLIAFYKRTIERNFATLAVPCISTPAPAKTKLLNLDTSPILNAAVAESECDEEDDCMLKEVDAVKIGDEFWIDHIQDEAPGKTYIGMERSIVGEKEAELDSSEIRDCAKSLQDLTIRCNKSIEISGVSTTLTNHDVTDMNWTYLGNEPGQIVVGENARMKEQLPNGYEQSFINQGCQDYMDLVTDKKFICTFQQLKSLVDAQSVHFP